MSLTSIIDRLTSIPNDFVVLPILVYVFLWSWTIPLFLDTVPFKFGRFIIYLVYLCILELFRFELPWKLRSTFLATYFDKDILPDSVWIKYTFMLGLPIRTWIKREQLPLSPSVLKRRRNRKQSKPKDIKISLRSIIKCLLLGIFIILVYIPRKGGRWSKF